MHKVLAIYLASLALALNAAGQEKANYTSTDELEREVTHLLLDKNINEVTRQLESENSTTVAALLRRLVIYSRAGQTSRVRKTLEQLPSAPNWQCPTGPDVRWLIRNAAGSDLGGRRFYYEKICPDDVEGVDEFLRLWTSIGDLKEIDAWLAERRKETTNGSCGEYFCGRSQAPRASCSKASLLISGPIRLIGHDSNDT